MSFVDVESTMHYTKRKITVSSFFLPRFSELDSISTGVTRIVGRVLNPYLMVMGFNTRVEHNGVVYHIQTEARKDSRIETVVYLGGAIIHSLKTSCRELLDSPAHSDETLRRRLEEQHRQVIERIRAGEIRPPAVPGVGSNPGA